MHARSLLFVPGDRRERFSKAIASGADAIILDLEDAVAASAKDAARANVRSALDNTAPIPRFVRINSLDHGMLDLDINAAKGADGVVLPKAEGASSVQTLICAWGADCPPILPIATETPAAIFEMTAYRDVSTRLYGLTWGAEDLPAAIGAVSSRTSDGSYTAPYELARSLTLFAAHAAGVPAIETVVPVIGDPDRIARYAARGAYDGFTGMMAIHPDQVAPINAAFSVSEEALTDARRVVAAFEAASAVGVIQVDGKMLDLPHLKHARNILARARVGT